MASAVTPRPAAVVHFPSMSLRGEICDFASSLDGAWRDPAWDMEGDVLKTAKGRIFLICAGAEHTPAVTLKLPTEDASAALTLPFVRQATWPSRWLTATISGETERDIVLEWVGQSYQLVANADRRKRP